jgi:hydroxyacylglutathione hydrolase
MKSFGFGNLLVTPLLTPCHTMGSVCYHVTDPTSEDSVVFTGDTLFVGGCVSLT